MAANPQTISFGHFELQPKSALLIRAGTPINLTGQPFRILVFLASRAGEVVTRDEIRNEIWGDSYNVEYEAAINVAVRKIREVLGESADAPVFLHTVRGRGYRFELGAPPSAPPEEEAPVIEPAPPAPPVAVPLALPPSSFPFRRQTRYIIYLVAVLVIGVITAAVIASSRRVDPGKSTIQFSYSGTVKVAAVSRDGAMLAYVDREKGDDLLHVCRIAGNQCSVLLRHVGDVHKLVFAPDGRSLYLGHFDGGAFPGSNILRVELADGVPTVIIRKTGWLLDVSADGKQILYLRRVPGNLDELLVSDPLGQNERLLMRRLSPDRITEAAFSPDGQHAAFWWLVTNASAHHHRLGIVSTRDGSESILTKDSWSPEFPVPSLAWPESGTILAAIHDPETAFRQLYRIGYPDGTSHRITNELSSYRGVSAGASLDLTVSVRDNTAPQIWIFDPRSPQNARPITSGAPGYRSPAWGKGEILAESTLGLWRIDWKTGHKAALHDTRRGDKRPFVSPDGKFVYFESKRSGEHAVWRTPLDHNGPSEQITFGSAGGRPSLSPDGHWMTYSAMAPDGWISVFRMPAAGGPSVLISQNAAATDPSFSPDGKWITARGEHGERRIYPFQGGPPAKQIPLLPGGHRLHRFGFAPDGSALTVQREFESVSNLWNQPLDGGQPVQITNFTSQLIEDWAWSTDGKLALSRSEQSADVVLLRGLLR